MPSIRRCCLAVLAAVVLLAALMVWQGPTSAEIRLDTGDLRHCFHGIPVSYTPMPEPQRSQLLALTKMSRLCLPVWVRCAELPQAGTNCKECMCRSFYHYGLAWLDEDPKIALAVLEDVAVYIKTTNAKAGLPESWHLFRYADQAPGGEYRLSGDWQGDPHVQAYIESHRK